MKKFFLIATLSSFYTTTVLPTKYTEQRHMKQRHIIALRGVRNLSTSKPSAKKTTADTQQPLAQPPVLIGSISRKTALPIQYREQLRKKQQHKIVLKDVRKSGVYKPDTKKTTANRQQPPAELPPLRGIAQKWLKPKFAKYEMTTEPALYDIPNAVDLMRRRR